MAARLSPRHDAATREKIKTSQLINRLNAFALSELDPTSGEPVQMSSAQVKAAETLLDRVLPKMQSIEGALDVTLIKHEQALDDLE